MVDDYACTKKVYGLDLPEKLFWEGYVMCNDITRAKGSEYDTGRPSMVEFQKMNLDTLRKGHQKVTSLHRRFSNTIYDDQLGVDAGHCRPVLWHGGCGKVGTTGPPPDSDPMCPLDLLMAYEENGNVTPVVSDFDCFLLGTRGVQYHQPLEELDMSMLSWCVDEIDGILSTPKEGVDWTHRWLDVKKKHVIDEGFMREMPRFGYAGEISCEIVSCTWIAR